MTHIDKDLLDKAQHLFEYVSARPPGNMPEFQARIQAVQDYCNETGWESLPVEPLDIDVVENRYRRLNRLVELNAPEAIINNEHHWLKRMAEFLFLIARNEHPKLTEEEQDELNQVLKLQSLYEGED
jgi:hypothetical protein